MTPDEPNRARTERATYNKRELARQLNKTTDEVYAYADSIGVPYEVSETVNGDGVPIVRRKYYRRSVDAFLDERGRAAARRAS